MENAEEDKSKWIRLGMQIAGGIIPFAGPLLSAAAGKWSEDDQDRVNEFLRFWIKTIEDELKEKQATILEIMARLDVHDEKIKERLKSSEYQSLVKKAFRDWAGVESERKREFIRNILSNAASASLTSDDVVRLFLDWIGKYSELHFLVIAEIYKQKGITRAGVWQKLNKGHVKENSADADLYKLLYRDLSTGQIIRQHREVDYHGNFVKAKPQRKLVGVGQVYKSAFDDDEEYELTELGQQFVHYAMTEIPVKIEYKPAT